MTRWRRAARWQSGLSGRPCRRPGRARVDGAADHRRPAARAESAAARSAAPWTMAAASRASTGRWRSGATAAGSSSGDFQLGSVRRGRRSPEHRATVRCAVRRTSAGSYCFHARLWASSDTRFAPIAALPPKATQTAPGQHARAAAENLAGFPLGACPSPAHRLPHRPGTSLGTSGYAREAAFRRQLLFFLTLKDPDRVVANSSNGREIDCQAM